VASLGSAIADLEDTTFTSDAAGFDHQAALGDAKALLEQLEAWQPATPPVPEAIRERAHALLAHLGLGEAQLSMLQQEPDEDEDELSQTLR
jgi:hypothetical protein